MSSSESDAAFTRARILAIAILMATIGYAVVGTVLVLTGVVPEGGLSDLPSQIALTLKAVLLLAGLSAAAASFMIRRMRDAKAPPGDAGIPMRTANLIVAMALVESAGVMGFVVVLLTGDAMFSLLLWGIAIAGCILHFPTTASFGVNR
jgi:hypothetical protein